MRIRSILACVALAPLLIAASPVRLQPSSPWDVDYAENSCKLIRSFGDGASKTLLMFESDAPGQMDMLAVGRPLESTGESIRARFLPGQKKGFDGQPTITAKAAIAGILWSGVPLLSDAMIQSIEKKASNEARPRGVRPPPIDLAERDAERAERAAFAAAATELEIDARPSRPVILETGSLGDALKAFDKCSRDSLRDWGIDPDLEDKIVRRPWAPDPRSWFSSEDYPARAMLNGEESEVRVRLLVDASGRVTKCTSLTHFDEPEFNRVVCEKMMARAKFEPAELADGTKVPSYYVNRIIFRIAG